MRLMIAGWQGQIAQALMEVAPRRSDVTACALGRPALNICEVGSIERALIGIRPDIIINTAAYTAVDTAEIEPERAFALNRDGPRMLARMAARRGIPIIHLSTSYVFDGSSTSAYVETDATAPATAYGRSKLEGEAAVQAENPKHIILRTAWVYSPYGRNFVTTIVKRAREGGPLRVAFDQHGSPTYAPHLADVILALVGSLTAANESDAAFWGIYHAAGSGRASWYDMAHQILSSSDDLKPALARLVAIPSVEHLTRTRRPVNSELDCTKLDQNFQIRLPGWREGVSTCIERLTVS